LDLPLILLVVGKTLELRSNCPLRKGISESQRNAESILRFEKRNTGKEKFVVGW
jgi:hypothetical protein